MLAVIYCEQNLLFVHPDHLCFDWTTYDNINGPGGPFMFDIIGPAGPLMYPDQIFRDSSFNQWEYFSVEPECALHMNTMKGT